MAKVVLFHGTSRTFDAFDATSLRRGADANSTLGVHLCEDPELAWHYATIDGSPDAQVLAVEIDLDRVGLITSWVDFFGVEDGMQVYDAADFDAARARLTARGLDGVTVDAIDPEVVGTWIVFDPAKLIVVGRMTSEDAVADVSFDGYDGVTMEGVTIFDDVEARLSASPSAPRNQTTAGPKP